MGLKKPHKQKRDLGDIKRWGLFMGSVQLGLVGLENWGDEISVNGEDGKRLLSDRPPTTANSLNLDGVEHLSLNH